MKLTKSLVTVGIAALMCVAATSVMAQAGGGGGGNGRNGGGRRGGRNFDPAQFQQQMMDNIRTQMDVKGDDEWKVIQDRIQKVTDARRAVDEFRMRGMFGFGRGGRSGNQDTGNNNGNNPNRRPRGLGGGTPAPEVEALQRAITQNGSAEQIKAALDRYRAARKAREETLTKAQQDLQQVLSVKQEAVAVAFALLD